MDNFVDIIVILFVIISFVASLFKKKTPDQQNKSKYEPTPGYKKPVDRASETAEEYDILRELEKVFNIPSSTTTTPPQEVRNENLRKSSEYTSYEGNRNASEVSSYEQTRKSSELESYEYKVSEGEHSRSKLETTFGRTIKKVDNKTEEQAKHFEELLKLRKKQNKTALEVRAMLRNPDSIQKAYILSEILGTPKSLQE